MPAVQANEAECINLGEQWILQGHLVIQYVKRLKAERDYINQRIFSLKDVWTEEKERMDSLLRIKTQAYEEACLKSWELSRRVDDLEKDASDFQREKLKLVQRLDREKQEFCAVLNKKKDERAIRLTGEKEKLEAKIRSLEEKVKSQNLDMKELKSRLKEQKEQIANLEDAQRSVAVEFEDRIQERVETNRDTIFALLGSLIRVCLTLPNAEEIEELLGKCPLDALQEEEFNEFLDHFVQEYEEFRESKQEADPDLNKLFGEEETLDIRSFREQMRANNIDLAGFDDEVFKLFGRDTVSRKDLQDLVV